MGPLFVLAFLGLLILQVTGTISVSLWLVFSPLIALFVLLVFVELFD